ncbi:hypothetical protein GCM10010517_70780 [Streptosporangium fragile]|uniref:Uncharacterized protein n=1 Tax=Streptosporangium fragile TaxID=46186 RepID=A0ABN3WAE5_9ACTN
MSVRRVMIKAAGVLGGAALVGTLLAAPASAATFSCSFSVLGIPVPLTVSVSADSVEAAETRIGLLFPGAFNVSCQLV